MDGHHLSGQSPRTPSDEVEADPVPSEIFPLISDGALAVLERLATPVYIYCFESGRICWSNPQARKFWNALGPEDLQNRDVAPQLRANRTRLAQYRSAFKRAEIRSETWTFFPGGHPISALCHCRGVSLSTAPEAMLVELVDGSTVALQQSELRSIEALRHTPLMISLIDLGGALLMRNPSASATFADYDIALTDETDAFSAMFAQTRDAADLRARALQDGIAEATVQIGLDPPRMHHVQVTKLADPATGRPSLLVAQQDVSASIETSRRLAASEDAMDRLLDLNFSPVLIVTVEGGRLIRCNQAAARLLQRRDVSIETGERVFLDEDGFSALAEMTKAKGVASAQLPLVRDNDKSFWAHLSGTPLRYRNRDALVFFLADVDELYRNASDLKAELGLEKKANELQRQVMAMASHEFRTPLALIDSAVQRLEAYGETLSHDQTGNILRRIRRSVRRLLELIERTTSGQTGRGSAELRVTEPIDLANLIQTCAQSLNDLNPEARIKLDLRSAPQLFVDSTVIEGALTNLIGNAIKYSDGPAEVEITAVEDRNGVTVTVRDHGIGVPPEERGAIFEEFARGSNVGQRTGTGLGLAIVRQAAERHGGRVELAQVRGRGTAFKLHLPRTIFA